nr:type I-B CRISPR-associated protein Cas5b [Bacillus mediterraneensis]
MQALRLKLYQETACYKKPFAFKVSETYPLPPYATVKGMLHAVLGAKKLIPMKISIQGKYDTIVSDYQTHYFFKNKKTNEFALILDGLGSKRTFEHITTMPIYMHMLYDVELLIHVQAEEDVLHELEQRIKSSNTHLSLGRWEDLVRVDECMLVTTQDYDGDEDPTLSFNAFVPERFIEDSSNYIYDLNWTYRIVKGVRVWDKIRAGYVQIGEPIADGGELTVDQYGDLIFFP